MNQSKPLWIHPSSFILPNLLGHQIGAGKAVLQSTAGRYEGQERIHEQHERGDEYGAGDIEKMGRVGPPHEDRDARVENDKGKPKEQRPPRTTEPGYATASYVRQNDVHQAEHP